MQANYFDPEALLAEDTVQNIAPVAAPGPHAGCMPRHSHQHLAPLQLVPCTFHYPVATMGQLLEPTCTTSEVSFHLSCLP
jgi:hypothetical protein